MYGGGLYGSSMFGGGMYGGLGGMGMGGMGGMGMGGAMGGIPGQPGGPGGFRQDYRTVFAGLNNILQILYSGLGLFSFGKLFGSMVFNLVKGIAKKMLQGGKWLYHLLFLNRVSAKIINGAVYRARSVRPANMGSYFMKILFTVGVIIFGICWFLIREERLEEEERKIRIQAEIRKREQAREAARMNEIIQQSPLLSGGTDMPNELVYESSRLIDQAQQSTLASELQRVIPEMDAAFEDAKKEVEQADAKKTEDENKSKEIATGAETENSDKKDSKSAQEVKEGQTVQEDKKEADSDDDSEADSKTEKDAVAGDSEPQAPATTAEASSTAVTSDKTSKVELVLTSKQTSKTSKKKKQAGGEREIKEKQRKRKEKVMMSEEFRNNRYTQEIAASENGNVLSRLFITGDLLETHPINRYTDEEKKKMLDSILARSQSTVVQTEAPANLVLSTAQSTQNVLGAQGGQDGQGPTIAGPENIVQTGEIAEAKDVPQPVVARKKKPWER